jgi:hypothetical protein
MTEYIDRGLDVLRRPHRMEANEAAVQVDKQAAELNWSGRFAGLVIRINGAKLEQTRVSLSVRVAADEAVAADAGELIVEVAPVEDHASHPLTAEASS